MRALRRPLLVTLVLGASVAMAATREAPPALLVSTTLCWSVVVDLPGAHRPGADPASGPRDGGRAPARSTCSSPATRRGRCGCSRSSPGRRCPAGGRWRRCCIAALVALALTFRMIAAHFQHVLGLDRRDGVAAGDPAPGADLESVCSALLAPPSRCFHGWCSGSADARARRGVGPGRLPASPQARPGR